MGGGARGALAGRARRRGRGERPRAARDRRGDARPRRRADRLARARPPRPRRAAGGGALRGLARPDAAAARRARAGQRLVRPGAPGRRAPRWRLRRARLPAAAGRGRPAGRRRPCVGGGGRRAGRRHRRALRRRRSARARPARAGARAGRAGAGGRRLPPARRGDGRRLRGRALAVRHRPRLLQRHRPLPRPVRAAAGPGVDRGARALVRRAAGPRRVHRALSGAPRRDPPASRRVGRGGRGGPACERSRRRAGGVPRGRGPPAAG